MTVLTRSGKKSSGIGALMLAHLAKVGEATTQELADAAKCSRKDAGARLWWLANKEGRVVARGEGAARTWALPKEKAATSAPKAAKEDAPAKPAAKEPKAASARPRAKKKASSKKAVKK